MQTIASIKQQRAKLLLTGALALAEYRARLDRPDRTPKAEPVTPSKKGTRRNAPCPCGSGRKFKACCLA